MWSEFKYTYLWAWRTDKWKTIRYILGLVAVLGIIGFIIYHSATEIPRPGTVSISGRVGR